MVCCVRTLFRREVITVAPVHAAAPAVAAALAKQPAPTAPPGSVDVAAQHGAVCSAHWPLDVGSSYWLSGAAYASCFACHVHVPTSPDPGSVAVGTTDPPSEHVLQVQVRLGWVASACAGCGVPT